MSDAEYQNLYLQLHADPGNQALREQLHARYLDLQRGGTTADGLPYPSPTDPVAEGADAIRALAEALGRPVANISARPPTASVSTYPLGLSLMTLSTSDAAAWPTGGGDATVLTIRRATGSTTSAAAQFIFSNVNASPRAYYRNAWATWSPWVSIASAFGTASGRFAFPSANSMQTVTQTVSFPSGIFTAAPDVQLTLGNTAAPALRTVSVGPTTTTSFVAAFSNQASGNPVTLDGIWAARQGPVSAFAARAAALAEAIPTRLVSCPNPGCPAYGEEKDVLTGWLDDAGDLQLVDAIVCGVDGTPIEAG